MEEKDLKSLNIRTDLVTDIIPNINTTVNEETYEENNIRVSNIFLDSKSSKLIGKKKGNYTTIFFEDITDKDNYNNVLNILIKELHKIINKTSLKKDYSSLIIGLGNIKSTPDSLGPKVIENIIVTKHIYDYYKSLEKGYKITEAFSPGVKGTTGIETSDIISSIIKLEKPDLLFVIDALASDSIDRVCKTIQITDAGINPGSGIGNERKEISYETLNIPVIAIGVPMVVDAVTIVSDTINYMEKHFSYNIKNINNPINKLIPSSMQNYLKEKDLNLTNNEKTYFFGKIGNLTKLEKRSLIFDVLTPIGNNLMVTPKEVDFVIDKLSNLISTGINNTIHEINI